MHLLQSKLPKLVTTLSSVPLADVESDDETVMSNATSDEVEDSSSPVSVNRYSYRAAIYANGVELSGGIG